MFCKEKRFVKSDFKSLFCFPRVANTKIAKIYIQKQEVGSHKIAVMCRRSIKGAVQRNFTKRIVKNALSCIMKDTGFSGLVGVVVNQSLKDKPKKEVYDTLKINLTKILK